MHEKYRDNYKAFFISPLLILVIGLQSYSSPNLVRDNHDAPHYGVYETSFKVNSLPDNPFFDVTIKISFIRPDSTKVMVDGFYDGGATYKARAYCDQIGEWRWISKSNHSELDQQQGTFDVVQSDLLGKLQKHPKDPFQFAYDNGDWFLHIGDTGYRFVVQSEPLWQEYIDEAVEAGFTKIRTWFAQSRGEVEALLSNDRKQLALPYWREIDKRINYCLNHYPYVILQLIPMAEDTQEIKNYANGVKISQYILQYAQARWSAFPNIHWTISNDREVVQNTPLTGRKVDVSMINQMGRDMKKREPWGTLITNHQARFTGYASVDEPWSDIITLEDLDQVTGEKILEYRKIGDDPIVLDEDRYELYRNPANARYFFRRFMWASLLSGGHGTYGGLKTYEPYDGGPLRGVQGYFTANQGGWLAQGAHDYQHIHNFFRDSGLTLVGMKPDDKIVGGNPLKWKCIHDQNIFIIYLANPDGDKPETDNPNFNQATVKITLPQGTYDVQWFDPKTGMWHENPDVTGGEQSFKSPQWSRSYSAGDWILLLKKHAL
jgi:uncharacterized protein DUF4038/uncharacterized protein DUF5060